jgi:hypothetical protein
VKRRTVFTAIGAVLLVLATAASAMAVNLGILDGSTSADQVGRQSVVPSVAPAVGSMVAATVPPPPPVVSTAAPSTTVEAGPGSVPVATPGPTPQPAPSSPRRPVVTVTMPVSPAGGVSGPTTTRRDDRPSTTRGGDGPTTTKVGDDHRDDD